MKIHSLSTKKLLVLFIILFILLRLPSFFEPNWHPDEGLYATVANSMTNGKILYRDIFDHKSPLIYFTYLIGTGLDKVFYVKLLNLLFGIMGLIGFSRLTLYFTNTRKAEIVSMLSFVLLFGSSIREGNIANTENFFVPITIWALVLALEKPSSIKYCFSGILFGIAYQYKFHALLDLFAICLFWISVSPRDWFKLFKEKLVWIAVGFLSVNILAILIFLLNGMLLNYINAVYLFSVSYSVDNRGFALNRFDIKLLSYFLLLIITYWNYKKKKYSEKAYLLLLLTSSALFAMSQGGRNYPHYYLQLVPYFSILLGIAYQKYFSSHKKALLLVLITFCSGLLLMHIKGGYKNAACQRSGILSPSESVFKYYYVFAKYLTGDKYPQYEYFNCIKLHIDDLQYGIAELDPEGIYIYDYIGWHYLAIGYEPPVIYFNPYHNYLSDTVAQDVANELSEEEIDIIVVRVDIRPDAEIASLLEDQYELVQSSEYYNYYQYQDNQ